MFVATQTVVEDGSGVTGKSQHPALGSRDMVFTAGVDELQGVGFDTAPSAYEDPGVQQARVAGRDRNRVGLLDQGLSRDELPAEHVHA